MVNVFSHGAVGHVGVALAFAFVVIAMMYALGHLSVAHINPAVRLAFWSVRRFPAGEVLPYVAGQCVGATTASLALRTALGPVGSMGATLPAIPVPAAFGVEWLLSFVLMFVIMAVATDERVADGFAAIAVGLTVCWSLLGCMKLFAKPSLRLLRWLGLLEYKGQLSPDPVSPPEDPGSGQAWVRLFLTSHPLGRSQARWVENKVWQSMHNNLRRVQRDVMSTSGLEGKNNHPSRGAVYPPGTPAD